MENCLDETWLYMLDLCIVAPKQHIIPHNDAVWSVLLKIRSRVRDVAYFTNQKITVATL